MIDLMPVLQRLIAHRADPVVKALIDAKGIPARIERQVPVGQQYFRSHFLYSNIPMISLLQLQDVKDNLRSMQKKDRLKKRTGCRGQVFYSAPYRVL